AAAARLPFVAGLDGYLPAAFGKLNPRYKTPWVSVLRQGLFGIVFVFLGQGGSSVAGAFNILVFIAVVIIMVPLKFLFTFFIRLQNRPRFPDQLTPFSTQNSSSLSPAETTAASAAISATASSANSASESLASFTSLTSFTSKLLGLIGFSTAAFATLRSLIPPAEEPHKLLYLLKLLGSTAALIALGLLIFHLGRRRNF